MKPNSISDLVMRLAAIFCLLASALAAIPGQPARAAGARYYVRASGGSDSNNGLSWAQAFKTLQAALTVVNGGDEVWVAKGVYYPDEGGVYPPGSRFATFALEDGVAIYGGFAGNETLLSQRNIDANPTILSGDVDNNDANTDGNFIAETTSDITGGNAYHVVTTSGNASTAILDGFILTAGQANDSSDPNNKGGGVYAYQSSATLRNLKFVGNYAMLGGGMVCVECAALSLTTVEYIDNYALYVGGGMANSNSTLSLTNGTFASNIASTSGGGMDNSNSTPSLENVIFYDNQSPLGGGMANRLSSHASLTNVTFSLNVASDKGGGMYNDTSNPGLSNVTFQSNSSVSGGGMYNRNSNPDVLGSAFTSNQADFGGGAYNDNSQPYLWMTTFTSNAATQAGGAILNASGSNANIQMTTFQGNQASVGGGIYNYVSNPFIKNVGLLNNQASSSSLGGGGMFNYNSSPVLERVNFTGNSTPGAGGGMYNYQGSNPSLTDVNFSGNDAYNGGGMRNHAGNNQPQLNRVTFSGNEAAYGGGMSNDNSTPTLTNVTFSGNLAQRQGGGMHNFQSSPNLMNVTFYGNTAEDAGGGGGMYNLTGSLPFLRGVILAGSVNGDCVNGVGGNIAGEYSLIQDTGANACGAVNGVSGFIVGQNPKLGVLTDNGGFTQTHALLPGSPAINAVSNNFCPSEDQRGVMRPQNSYCDIGAYEFGALTFRDVPANYWAYSWIERLYAGGITGGCGNAPLIYCPDNQVTRAQMAIFLLRGIHGSTYNPPPASGSMFGDVPTSAFAAAWIEQLATQGITSGCGGGNYCPDASVTRAQMAIFLLRSKYGAGYTPPPVGASTGFNDVPPTYWAAAWIKQLSAEGITSGCGGGNYCPDSSVSRAQMAVFLVKTFNLP